MLGATFVSFFAWYVIYTNKEAFKRKHLLTIHGKLGCFVLVSYLFLGVFGGVALNPSWGFLNKNATVRFAHKICKWFYAMCCLTNYFMQDIYLTSFTLAGRLLTALAWTSCVLGLNNMKSDSVGLAIFAFPLLIFGYYVLI